MTHWTLGTGCLTPGTTGRRTRFGRRGWRGRFDEPSRRCGRDARTTSARRAHDRKRRRDGGAPRLNAAGTAALPGVQRVIPHGPERPHGPIHGTMPHESVSPRPSAAPTGHHGPWRPHGPGHYQLVTDDEKFSEVWRRCLQSTIRQLAYMPFSAQKTFALFRHSSAVE